MTEYQTGPRRLSPGFDLDGHLDRLEADGFTIVKDYLSVDQLARFREGLKPYLNKYRRTAWIRSDGHLWLRSFIRRTASPRADQ